MILLPIIWNGRMKLLVLFRLRSFLQVFSQLSFLPGRFYLPIYVCSTPKLPDYHGKLSLAKAIFRKCLKKKCKSETNLQIPFQYFST